MTFKDLKKKVTLELPQQYRLTQSLHNKPFWIWDVQEHKQEDIRNNGNCCFNHIIRLPKKDSVEKPPYDYQAMIFDSLVTKDDNSSSNNKHLWIKKATGLGISEFMLRFMAWLCLKDSALAGSQICIVTGPRIDLAIALIERMKKLFSNDKKGLTVFHTKETGIDLNGVKIEAFPSHHLDAMRGLPNVSFILLDEADFFPPGQQQDARDVSERYIAKSNPGIREKTSIKQNLYPMGLYFHLGRYGEDEIRPTIWFVLDIRYIIFIMVHVVTIRCQKFRGRHSIYAIEFSF
jgi:hypothetical protein